jgi:hypothetical protein
MPADTRPGSLTLLAACRHQAMAAILAGKLDRTNKILGQRAQ